MDAKQENEDIKQSGGSGGGLAIVAAIAVALGAAIACQPKTDPTLEEACPPCTGGAGAKNWNCVLDIQNQVQDQYKVVCAPDDDDLIDAACNTACIEWSASHSRDCVGWTNPHETYHCIDTLPDTEGDPPWEPGGLVSYSGGVYHVDSSLVDMLKDDGALLAYDGAWLMSTSTYWQFKDVGPNSLAYALGFRTNDYVKKVNGTTVTSLQTVLDLLHDNYASTSFSVQIQRGSSTLTYYYVID